MLARMVLMQASQQTSLQEPISVVSIRLRSAKRGISSAITTIHKGDTSNVITIVTNVPHRTANARITITTAINRMVIAGRITCENSPKGRKKTQHKTRNKRTRSLNKHKEHRNENEGFHLYIYGGTLAMGHEYHFM